MSGKALLTLVSIGIVTATGCLSASPFRGNTIASPIEQVSQYRGLVGDIDAIARQVTVRISTPNNPSHGSGVIIAREDNTYYVATVKHNFINNIPEYKIVTPDGKEHKINLKNIDRSEAYDLAIFSFQSDNNYRIATIANYQWQKQWVFASGFRKNNNNSERILTAGKIFPKDEASFVVKDAYSLQNGNELVYSNDSYPGMGGGAVLDSDGRLMGIHTSIEGELVFDDRGNFNLINTGYALGISAKNLLDFINKTQLSTEILNIETNTAKLVNSEAVRVIEKQL